MITYNEYLQTLNEMPQEIDDITIKRAKSYFYKRFKDINFNKDILEEIDSSNVFLYDIALDGSHVIVMYIKDNQDIAASELKKTFFYKGTNKTKAFEVIYSSKLSYSPSNGVLYKMYKTVSRFKNSYIMSGKQQTPSSKKIWLKWLREENDIFGYDVNKMEELSYKTMSNHWCLSDKCQNRRIIVKF